VSRSRRLSNSAPAAILHCTHTQSPQPPTVAPTHCRQAVPQVPTQTTPQAKAAATHAAFLYQGQSEGIIASCIPPALGRRSTAGVCFGSRMTNFLLDRFVNDVSSGCGSVRAARPLPHFKRYRRLHISSRRRTEADRHACGMRRSIGRNLKLTR
jgi:hypothetical protein